MLEWLYSRYNMSGQQRFQQITKLINSVKSMPDNAYFKAKPLYNTIREYAEQIKRFNNQLHSLRLYMRHECLQNQPSMQGIL